MRIISYYETKESNSINDANNNYVLRFHKELNYSTNWYHLYRIVEFNTKKFLPTKLARFSLTSNVVNILSLRVVNVSMALQWRVISKGLEIISINLKRNAIPYRPFDYKYNTLYVYRSMASSHKIAFRISTTIFDFLLYRHFVKDRNFPRTYRILAHGSTSVQVTINKEAKVTATLHAQVY